jgi:hypothetical protein
MRIIKSNPARLISLWPKLVVGFSFIFTFHISAQLKFTVQLSNGTCQQYSYEGLKLTFNNNSSFSILQNGTSQNLNFAAVDKVTYSGQILNILNIK